MAIVDYLVARTGCPPRSGLAYDYVLAKDGLFVVAENDFLAVRMPAAPCPVRGLAPIYPTVQLTHGLLPHQIWGDIVDAARLCAVAGREVLLAVIWDGRGYRLVAPVQVVAPTRVYYQPLPQAVLEVHSHHQYPARFSPIDDADEQRLCLYAVLGRLNCDQPAIALRVGAYGYFMPVPWEGVFAGDRGAFRDVQFDRNVDRNAADDLPD